VVFQPAQVRAYAAFHLQRAKNDKIDAALIASCTAAERKNQAYSSAALFSVSLFDRRPFLRPDLPAPARRRAQTPSRLAVAQPSPHVPASAGHALTAASTASCWRRSDKGVIGIFTYENNGCYGSAVTAARS
jgi:hypothetical protein